MIRTVFALCCALLLTACQAPTVEPFTLLDFKNETPIMIPVHKIRIENHTTRYTELPHIESRLPVRPDFALAEALNNRFAAGDPMSPRQILFVIQTADMTQKSQTGEHWYILDNTEYTLSYQVGIAYTKSCGITETQTITGWEKQALPKRSSLAEKEAAWQKMINQMIQKTVDKIQADMPGEFQS